MTVTETRIPVTVTETIHLPGTSTTGSCGTAPEVTDLCYDASGNLAGTSTAGSCAASPPRSYTHGEQNRGPGGAA